MILAWASPFNAGPPSATLTQHLPNIESMYRVLAWRFVGWDELLLCTLKWTVQFIVAKNIELRFHVL